jgi:hypothetical protein
LFPSKVTEPEKDHALMGELSNEDEVAEVLVSSENDSISGLGGAKHNIIGGGQRYLSSHLCDVVALQFELQAKPTLDILVDENLQIGSE